MRNAATFDDDFGYDEPRRRAAASRKSRPAPGKGRKRKGGAFRLDTRKVVRYVAVGLSTALVVGIAFNALVLQKTRHPSPLFGKALASGRVTAPAPVAAKADTPPAAAEPDVAIPEATPQAPSPAKPRHVASATTAKAAPDRAMPDKDAAGSDDAIARLLNGPVKASPRAGGLTGEKTVEKAGDPSQAKTVTGVQHALAKLGFTVKATGTLGPQTHKAIEAFEKDRHMPVTGELSHRLAKVLAAESGLKID